MKFFLFNNAQRLSISIMDKLSEIIDKDFYAMKNSRMYSDAVNRVEKFIIVKALQRSYGNQIEAARMLGVHRNTLHNKIKKFKIDVMRFKQ
jgi:two-component system nitrogen regulation response regulator GlnG